MTDFVIGAMACSMMGAMGWLMRKKIQRETANEKEIDYNEGEKAGTMMGAMGWLMGKKTERETAKEKQIDYNEGEKIDYNSEEKILFPRRIIMPNLHKRTYKTVMKGEDLKGEEDTFLSEGSTFQEESMMLRRPRWPSSTHVVVRNVKDMKENAKQFGEKKRRLFGKRKLEEGSMPLRKLGKTPPEPPDVTNVKEMKEEAEEFVEKKRRLSDKGKFEEGSVTSADEVSICTSENIKKDEGNQRQWKEERNTQCELTHETCVMRLYNFCWKKVQIGDDIVEAKKIMLFAAMRSSIENEIFLDIGYYWQLPRCREILNLNDAVVLHVRPFVFFREGQLPLTIILNKVVPPIWKYNEETNAKIISFTTVVFNEGDFCTFNLKKGVADEKDRCACFFKAVQGSHFWELVFLLKESSLSRAQAIILPTANGIADSQEQLPSVFSRTKVRKKLLQKLSNKLGKCWRNVGRNLKLDDDQLDSLELTYNSNHEEKVYQMLLVWKRQNTSAATNGVLGDALGNTGRVDLRDWVLGGSEPT